MPTGPGDNNVLNDKYAAVLQEVGNQEAGIGSNVYIIECTTGKVLKEIKIADKDNNIVNSIPAIPVDNIRCSARRLQRCISLRQWFRG